MNREDESKYLQLREDRNSLDRTAYDLQRTLESYRGVDLQNISVRERASYDALRQQKWSLQSRLNDIGSEMGYYEEKDSESGESDHD